MKTSMKLVAFAALSFLYLCVGGAVFGQTEKLGTVQYKAPAGWTKTSKVENVLAYSTVDQATGRFCIITLYGATPGAGDPQSDFRREWKNLVIDTLGAAANPKTETQADDGWTATAGGAVVDFQGSKAAAFLTVLSGHGRTVSVLGVFNNESYLSELTAFVSSLKIDKSAPAPQPAAASIPTQDGKVIIPMPSRQLTVADLIGEWAETAGFSTTYVDRYTGAYAGTDSLHYRTTMKIGRGGAYTNDFFAIQNGKKIIDKTSGTIAIVGRVLSVKEGNTARYVIRGWLDLPGMTVLKICGPWYGDSVIPEEIFTNPDQGANLNKNWIRKK